jgi:hypothetical protein
MLSLRAVLDDLDEPASVEMPIPDDTDADVVIVAKIRNGRLRLETHYEVAKAHPDRG